MSQSESFSWQSAMIFAADVTRWRRRSRRRKAMASKRYWLLKCEPEAYSIDDLERDGKASWEGVRNFQARNLLRDELKVGDGVLFYASNAEPSGVTGLAE